MPGAAEPSSGLRATWLGHSTVLLEIDGVRVLTDPVWGTRASPLRLAGPKRFQPVPVPSAGDAAASIVVVISHDHYDHLDYPTIRALARDRRAVRHARSASARTSSAGACRRSASPSSTGGSRIGCRTASSYRDGGAVAAFFRPRAKRPQFDAVVVARDPIAASPRVLQRRHRAHHRVRGDPRAARPVRPGDAGGRRASSFLGRHPPRAAATRSRRWRCSAAARFCRSTGAPSASRCTRGTSRQRRCWHRKEARTWSCRASASPSSRCTANAWIRGGAASMRCPSKRGPRQSRCRNQCLGPWTDGFRRFQRTRTGRRA